MDPNHDEQKSSEELVANAATAASETQPPPQSEIVSSTDTQTDPPLPNDEAVVIPQVEPAAPVQQQQPQTVADKLAELDADGSAILAGNSTTSNGTNGINLSQITPQEMDMAELKVKIICQEKSNQALKMELKCAELQVAAKEKLDTKKTRLIELLEAKLATTEKRNQRLMELMERSLADKETHSKRLIDATRNMEDLGRRLADSERERIELRRINQELRTMLGNMEGKGADLARLAKEKVLKYRDENERIQRELDGLRATPESAAGVEASPDGVADEVCRSLETTLAVGDDGDPERLKKTVADASRLVADRLRPIVDQLKSQTTVRAELEAKCRELAGLKQELDRLKTTIGGLVGLQTQAPPSE
jgi:chromosome segregation ATPase